MLYILEIQQAQICQGLLTPTKASYWWVYVYVCVCFLMCVLTDPLDSPYLGPNNYFQ